MKNNQIDHAIEYLSPIFIISYFFIHNILLVLLGITMSFYLLNINFIMRIIRYINRNTMIKDLSRYLNQNKKKEESDLINIKYSEKDSSITLVDTIEELGFIPSIDKIDDTNAV